MKYHPLPYACVLVLTIGTACTVALPDGSYDTSHDSSASTDTDFKGTLLETADTHIPSADSDSDSVPDNVDNCPSIANTDQADLDDDDLGDNCDDDRDGDYLTDGSVDQWPNEIDWPGHANPEYIYAHTRDTLYAMEIHRGQPNDEDMTLIGPFSLDKGSLEHGVTDLALDEYGIISVITTTAIYQCQPRVNAQGHVACRQVGQFQGDSHAVGMTLLPPTTLYPKPRMILLDGTEWQVVDMTQTPATVTTAGYLGPAVLGDTTYTSETSVSGDAFSIADVGTYATVRPNGDGSKSDLVTLDPNTGKIASKLASLPEDADKPFGLAGWYDGTVYIFDKNGTISKFTAGSTSISKVEFRLFDAAGQPLSTDGISWWGAGVRTVIPILP